MPINNWDEIDRIAGYMSRPECEWLASTASKVYSWTELGGYCGRSIMAVALHLPKGASLRVVDLYLGQCMAAGQTLFTTYNEITQKRPDLTWILVRMDSARAAEVLPETEVCFVDASHAYENVKADILAWQSKSDILCGHDYGYEAWKGVKQAVDELLPDPERPAGSIWVARNQSAQANGTQPAISSQLAGP